MLTTILIASVLFANIVYAIPGIPNAFYGSVSWNGSPAPDGTTIIAKINGVQVASTTTSQGKYGYSPMFYVDDPNNVRSGNIINFFVNNVNTGQTAIFSNGAVTQLDLSASGGTTQPSSSGTSTSGSSYIPPTQQNQTAQQGCQERWTCTEWSTCKDGVQTRTCNDINNCGTRNNEPFSSQPCSAEEEKEAEQAQASITGFFLGLTTVEWATAIILGMVIAAIIIFLVKRKQKRR